MNNIITIKGRTEDAQDFFYLLKAQNAVGKVAENEYYRNKTCDGQPLSFEDIIPVYIPTYYWYTHSS